MNGTVPYLYRTNEARPSTAMELPLRMTNTSFLAGFARLQTYYSLPAMHYSSPKSIPVAWVYPGTEPPCASKWVFRRVSAH